MKSKHPGGLLVYGDIAMDITLESPSQSNPLPGQDAAVADMHFNPGGSAANCAAIAARLGTPTTFLGFVGTDDFGLKLIADLKNFGVNMNHVQQNPGKSGVTVAIVNPGGERTFYSFRGVNKTGKLEAIDKDLFENIKILHVSGYSFQDENSRGNAIRLIEAAHERGVLISLDPSYWYAKKKPLENKELLRKIDIILPNLEEARLMTGVDDPSQACSALQAMGAKVVVVKLGQEGCYVSENNQITKIPAFPVEKVVDTTGAGDAFCSGFLTGILKGLSKVAAARMGNAAAAKVVGVIGGHQGAAGMGEILELVSERPWDDLK
jgi:ribokinase